jgi:hypothetical protein
MVPVTGYVYAFDEVCDRLKVLHVLLAAVADRDSGEAGGGSAYPRFGILKTSGAGAAAGAAAAIGRFVAEPTSSGSRWGSLNELAVLRRYRRVAA